MWLYTAPKARKIPVSETCKKGRKAELIVMAEAAKRGYMVAVPMGHDSKYDLIVERNGKLERVQCKYTQSNADTMRVACRSASEWVNYKYTAEDIDWIAVYDETTDKCYYLPSSFLGQHEIHLRFSPTKNNQAKGILWAKDFLAW